MTIDLQIELVCFEKSVIFDNVLNVNMLYILFSRGYYIVVVPLKKQRTGKFFKPWDNPDEMNLEEVGSNDELVIMTGYQETVKKICHVTCFYDPVTVFSGSARPT